MYLNKDYYRILCIITVANNKEKEDKPNENEPSPTASDQIELKDMQTVEHPIAGQTAVSILRDPSDVVLNVKGNQILQRLVDICCCAHSKKKTRFKRFNLLDFAAESACHHIFFSSRAFNILLVDISKDLNSPMDGGFYSDWTYAGK